MGGGRELRSVDGLCVEQGSGPGGGGGLQGFDLMRGAEWQFLVVPMVQLERMAFWALLVWQAAGMVQERAGAS